MRRLAPGGSNMTANHFPQELFFSFECGDRQSTTKLSLPQTLLALHDENVG